MVAGGETAGAGFEPAGDSDITADGECTCDFCLGAANALQTDGSRCLDVASHDANLQQVISVWDELPVAM
jgi:hypothetical protein